MHIAAALGTPLIALFGSTDEKATGPYGQDQAVIHKHVKCSPCFKRVCPIDMRCMTQISVDEIVQRVRPYV
jgi:heptosyltransferase-2